MKKWFQRIASLALVLLTVVSMLPVMGLPMEAEAAEELPNQTITIPDVPRDEKKPSDYPKAVTYDDVTAIVEDYWKTVTHNDARKVFWNNHVRNSSDMKKWAFNDTVTTKACTGSSSKGTHSHSKEYGGSCPGGGNSTNNACTRRCTSNHFQFRKDGLGDAQCEGFANYMAYVVFKQYCADWVKYEGKELPEDYQIKPGDVIRVKWNWDSKEKASHSMFVYKVEGNKAYYIECNYSGRCSIDKKRSIDIGKGVDVIRNTKGGYLISSPAVSSLKTYTIQFDANKPTGAANATGTMESQKAWIGTSTKLDANVYEINNYIFQGWNTQKNGKGASYKDGSSVTDLATEDGATVTLYAQWMSKKANDYLTKSTSYASSLRAKSVVGSILHNIKSLPCTWATCTESKTVRALKKNETLTVLELLKNREGNYWYRVKADSDGAEGYIFHEYIDVWSENNVKFDVKLATYNIKKGKGCQIYGSVSSKYSLASVTGVLDDSNPNTAAQSQTITKGFSKIQDTSINDKLGFGKLNRGKGTLTLTAEMSNNYRYDAEKKTHVRVSETKVIDFVVVAQYKVKYNANTTDSVSNMPGAQNKTDGKNITLSTKIPSREGYTFKGWSLDKSAAKETYIAGATLSEDTATGDMTLYAVWQRGKANAYLVTYNANGGSGAPASQTKQKDKDLILSKAAPTRKGYTFDNWSDGKATYQPGGTYIKNENAELIAQWHPIAYTICYSKNGGIGTMAGTAAVYDMEATLSANEFTRTGYTFAGWNTKADGTGTMYQPGDQVKNLVDTSGTDRILYAIWKKTEAPVENQLTAEQYMAKCTSYFSAGTLKITSENAWLKSLPCSDSTCKTSANVHGSALPKGTVMTVTGLYKNSENNYWYQVAWDGKTGYIYAPQAEFTAAKADFVISSNASKPVDHIKGENFSIYGTVTSNIGTPYQIEGIISNSKGKKDSQTVTSNKKIYSLAYGEFNNGLSFGQLATGSYKYTVRAYVTCYYSTNGTELLSKELSKTLIDHSFKVVVKTHTLTFLSGHGENKTIKTLKVKDKGTFTIPDIGYQREGYKFLGYTVKRLKDGMVYGDGKWQTEQELANSGKSAQIYTAGRKMTMDNSWTKGGVLDSNYQFVGVWEALSSYTVIYDANGGTGAPASQTKTHGITLTLSDAVPTRTGYTFLGWAESAAASSADYQKGGSYTKDQNVTLYAVWTENTAYVLMYADSGMDAENMPENQSFVKGESLTLSTKIPTCDGLVFKGWSTELNGEYTEFQPGDTVTFDNVEESVTLWAIWGAAPYQLYDANANKYYMVDPNTGAISEIKAFDTAKLCHITASLNPSDEILEMVGDPDNWHNLFASATLGLPQCDIPVLYQNGKLDFYAPVGMELISIGPVNFAFTVKKSEALEIDVQVLRVNTCGGVTTDTEDTLENMAWYYAPDYPRDLWVVDPLNRVGYTHIGWARSADATVPELDTDFTFADLTAADTMLYAVWETTSINVYDVNANKYWQINRSNYAVTTVPSLDTSDLAHITITLNPSEAIRKEYAENGSLQKWYEEYDFCIGPLGPGEGFFQISGNKFDFYVSKGIYNHCRNGANGADSFDFRKSANLIFNICVLTFDASYDDHTEVSTHLFVGNYPYNGKMMSYPVREGYTLVGWSKNPDAVNAEYPREFPWAFDADTTLYAVWEKQT